MKTPRHCTSFFAIIISEAVNSEKRDKHHKKFKTTMAIQQHRSDDERELTLFKSCGAVLQQSQPSWTLSGSGSATYSDATKPPSYSDVNKIADDVIQAVNMDNSIQDELEDWTDLVDPLLLIDGPRAPVVDHNLVRNDIKSYSHIVQQQDEVIGTAHPSIFDTPISFTMESNMRASGLPHSKPVISYSTSHASYVQQSNDEYTKKIESLDKILESLLRGCNSRGPVNVGSMPTVPIEAAKPKLVTPRSSIVSVESIENQNKRKIDDEDSDKEQSPSSPVKIQVESPKKKPRVEKPDEKSLEQLQPSDDSFSPSFRTYQTEKWNQKYEELCVFREEEGHCNVPYTHEALIHWVKRQRYQYKLKMEGRPSTMTDERMEKLEKVGFVWDAHASIWHERLQELKAYHQIHGHCNVPSKFASNPKLAVWAKCQRRQWKL